MLCKLRLVKFEFSLLSRWSAISINKLGTNGFSTGLRPNSVSGVRHYRITKPFSTSNRSITGVIKKFGSKS